VPVTQSAVRLPPAELRLSSAWRRLTPVGKPSVPPRDAFPLGRKITGHYSSSKLGLRIVTIPDSCRSQKNKPWKNSQVESKPEVIVLFVKFNCSQWSSPSMITAKQMGFPAYRRRELACDFSAINLFIF
jgi:hypothetical protein